MSILPELKERFRVALAGLVDDPTELLEQIRRSQDPKFGDYQANMAMPLGKRLRRPPRDVAAELVSRLDLSGLCEPPEIAGPGFINLRLTDQWLIDRLTAAVGDLRLGVAPVAQPRTFVVDYSAPNVAKPMHVGHIRSTVIGDALCRILRFLGHTAISDNHIGDWGTQFGMILYGWRNFRDDEAYRRNPVEELARLYRLVRKLMDDEVDEPRSINDAVLAETAKLHAGDAECRRLWQEFLPFCEDEIERMYRRLDVRFDHSLGESFYEDRLGPLVDELLQRGIARHSEGAVCIFIEGQKTPMLVRKKDGAFLYGTTDLATIRYRMETWRPDAILYVVDHRQSLHFQQLFAAARLLDDHAQPWEGEAPAEPRESPQLSSTRAARREPRPPTITKSHLDYKDVELQHVSFGTVLGDDGRPFKTRSGDTVGLEGLLDEAVRRALEIVAANDDAKPDGPELSPQQRQQIAETIGIAALKYADLSQNRTSDYVFSYDKMLAMTGNTATYMQYAYARVRSIFAKAAINGTGLIIRDQPSVGASPDGALRQLDLSPLSPAITLGSPAERALGLELLRFSEALDMAVADYRPNQLTSYLFDLANRYSTFFEQCHVLRAESEPLRQSRLLLCDLTARTIEKGLELLGIKVVERM